jgi:hypothetical protein
MQNFTTQYTELQRALRDFRFLPLCKLELRSFVILRNVKWQFPTDVAGQLTDRETSVRNCHSVLLKIPKSADLVYKQHSLLCLNHNSEENNDLQHS